MGSSSVCFGAGYETPDWALPDPEARPGELVDISMPSKALRRDARSRVYLPARFRPPARYPLLVVHDGGDFLQYAAMKTVLDNLIHRLDVAEIVVAFIDPGDRLVEYANSAAHARFVTTELLPELEARAAADRAAGPAAACWAPASARSRRCRPRTARRETYGSLVLMSGSFVFTDIAQRPRRRPGVRPGREVRQPLPRPPAPGRRPAVRQLRRLRAADRPQPLDGADVRVHRHGRPLRRGPRRPQLGELARPAARRAVLRLPGAAAVLPTSDRVGRPRSLPVVVL